MGPSVKTSIDTSDGSVSTSPSKVLWVLASAGSTGGAWQLVDGDTDTGDDKLSGVSPANSMEFLDFSNAPIDFNLGIFADIPGTNITLTIGYTD